MGYEGDFVVLANQVGTNILKKMAGKTHDPNTPTLKYIFNYDPSSPAPSVQDVAKGLDEPEFLLNCLIKRANFLHHGTARNFQKAVEASKAAGAAEPAALDMVKIEMMRMTYAHAYVLYAQFFQDKLKENMSKEIRGVLELLFQLFCLTLMDGSYERGGGFGDFCAAKALPPDAHSLILDRTK